MWQYNDFEELYHYGVPGMRWGRRKANPLSGGISGMIRRRQMINSNNRMTKINARQKQVNNELKELHGYERNATGLAKSRLSTAIRRHQINSLNKTKNKLNAQAKTEKKISKELKDIDDYQNKKLAEAAKGKAKVDKLKTAYKTANKQYSKDYDKAYAYSGRHLVSQYFGKNKQTSDANWSKVYKSAQKAEQARKAYKAAKKKYR